MPDIASGAAIFDQYYKRIQNLMHDEHLESGSFKLYRGEQRNRIDKQSNQYGGEPDYC